MQTIMVVNRRPRRAHLNPVPIIETGCPSSRAFRDLGSRHLPDHPSCEPLVSVPAPVRELSGKDHSFEDSPAATGAYSNCKLMRSAGVWARCRNPERSRGITSHPPR